VSGRSDPGDLGGSSPTPNSPGARGKLVDPMLALELETARADKPVAALIQVRGGVRRALDGAAKDRAADPADPVDPADPAAGQASELGQLASRIAGGAPPPPGWVVELFPELGALYLSAPAEHVARLLADPDVASATVPDQGP